MADAGYWAEAPMKREQIVLFAPTLDTVIEEDHPVRVLDEILRRLDWTEWEAEFSGSGRGQPPIHPRVLSGALIYGLSRGIRSSRVLEYLIGHNFDFIWLVERRTIDHSTLSKFRKKFGKPLKSLFRQVCELAMAMGLARLNEVALDGTRVKANNDRFETLTAAKVQERLAAVDAQIDQMFREADETDAAEAKLFDVGSSSTKLPAELAKLQTRQEKLRKALEQLRAADKAKRADGGDPEKNPSQIPATDMDSKVLPNKEGGYAANYTPMAATETHGGFILDADVIPDTSEQLTTLPAADRIRENFGQYPDRMMGDGAHGTGENIQGMEERDVEFFAPVASHQPQPGNPAWREDPTQPVPEEERARLPRNPQTKKLDKSCFVYDKETDRYYCPMGRPLDYEEKKSNVPASGQRTYFHVYRGKSCEGCPLSAACRKDDAKQGRSISRDVHEERREGMARKMATAEAKAVYRRRLHAAETPFGIIKHVMKVRQFLLRGLENVKTEWLWICTAFNIRKLMQSLARLRAESARLAAETEV